MCAGLTQGGFGEGSQSSSAGWYCRRGSNAPAGGRDGEQGPR
jgi:hypothetical protein